jgi:hypothetical protein
MALLSRELTSSRCAYCGAPLTLNAAGVVAWRVGNQFVCNEFCADGLPDEMREREAATAPQRRAQAPKSAPFRSAPLMS